MSRLERRLLAAAGSVVVVALWPATAAAHPLGNFSVNVYSGITVSPHDVRVDYVVDMAEIPTFQETAAIDTDGDGEVSATERASWARRAAGRARPQLRLELAGKRVPLTLLSSSMVLRPGQGGLQTLRLEASFAAPAPASGRLVYRDLSYPGRIGWREVVATGNGVALLRSSVPERSLSQALRRYPEDLLSSPLSVTEATLSFRPGVGGATGTVGEEGIGTGTVPRAPSSGGFPALVSRPSLSPAVVAVSLLLALAFGAGHALAPGHGKIVMAGYLVGEGRRVRQATAVAGAVAAMHTASVLVLGVLVLAAERAFAPERAYPLLGMVSGGAAMVLGTSLLARRARGNQGRGRAPGGEAPPHRHLHPGHRGHALSARSLLALALSGGILPSPTALVVVVASAALGRLAFGLALVVAFGIGLAATLFAVGALAMRLRDAMALRVGRLARLGPVGGAAAVLGMGALLVARSAVAL